jgi:nucleotide-binding universal stress UspA family protein
MTTESKTERVVVGVDGSPVSEAAIKWAAHYAEAVGATIQAVLAWHYPAAFGQGPVGVAPADVTADVERSRHEIIDKAIEAALGGDPAQVPIERKIAYGHPAEVLIDESKDADLLVVGHRGHGGFTGMLVGSVSTHLVNHAHCPVTVVRAV